MSEILRNLIVPNPALIIGFTIILFCDLFAGVRKAKKNQEATTSKGLRRTIDKGASYSTFLISFFVIFNVGNIVNPSGGFKGIFGFTLDGLLTYCIYIEFKSVLENIIEINTVNGKKSFFVEKLVEPIHNLLILKFKNKKDENDS